MEKEITLEESSPTILYKARALSRILTKKCRTELAALDKTHLDWEYRAFELKQKLMLEHRREYDEGRLSNREAKRRHRNRLKTVMKNAVRSGMIPARTVKGPPQRAPQLSKEEKSKVKNRL